MIDQRLQMQNYLFRMTMFWLIIIIIFTVKRKYVTLVCRYAQLPYSTNFTIQHKKASLQQKTDEGTNEYISVTIHTHNCDIKLS